MWYKLTWIYVRPNGVEKKVRPTETVLFNFGDWTDSQWTETSSWSQWTITKTANYITFYHSSNYAVNYLSQYPIDWTKDFLLEMNADIPNTSRGYNYLGLIWANYSITFETNWESSWRNKINCDTSAWRNGAETNPWTADYFIKKEWNVLTMGRWWATKYTNNNYTFDSTYYLEEKVYRDTLTINTAKLTYL